MIFNSIVSVLWGLAVLVCLALSPVFSEGCLVCWYLWLVQYSVLFVFGVRDAVLREYLSEFC